MFRKLEKEIYLEEFIMPLGGKFNANNRWVKLAKIIPWDIIEDRYAENFRSNRGKAAKPVRMALGSLLIQEKLKFPDLELVEQITENPYLQYFIGFREYQDKPPFDPSLMIHFRKRFTAEMLKEINEEIYRAAKETEGKKKKDDDDNKSKPPSGGKKAKAEETATSKEESSFEVYPAKKGKLILDATCAPADIRYPTDLSLLNEAKEKLDGIIDTVHKALGKPGRRPRTYRQVARKDYLSIVRSKKPGKKAIRKAVGKQLGYVRRNLRAAECLIAVADDRHGLNKKQQYTAVA